MPTHSDIADRVLWEGEGAVSSRQLLHENPLRTPSTIGCSSVQGDTDTDSIAYGISHDDSMRKLQQQVPQQSRRQWLARFRRHRIEAPKIVSNHSALTTTVQKMDTKMKQQTLLRPAPIESRARTAPVLLTQEDISPTELRSQVSVRTTRNQFDGTSLLVKQNAKVFNRNSAAHEHLSVGGDDDTTVSSSVVDAFAKVQLVRRVSSMSMESNHQVAHQPSWGDPLDTFLLGSRDEEDEEEDDLDPLFTTFLQSTEEERKVPTMNIVIEEKNSSMAREQAMNDTDTDDDIDSTSEVFSIASDPGSLDYDGFFDDPGSPNSMPPIPSNVIAAQNEFTFSPSLPVMTAPPARKTSLKRSLRKEEQQRQQLEDIRFVPRKQDTVVAPLLTKPLPLSRAYTPPSALTTRRLASQQPTLARPARIDRRSITFDQIAPRPVGPVPFPRKPDLIDRRAMTSPDNLTAAGNNHHSMASPARTAAPASNHHFLSSPERAVWNSCGNDSVDSVRVSPRPRSRRPIEDCDEPPAPLLAPPSRKLSTPQPI